MHRIHYVYIDKCIDVLNECMPHVLCVHGLQEMAEHVKTVDPNHLVTSGELHDTKGHRGGGACSIHHMAHSCHDQQGVRQTDTDSHGRHVEPRGVPGSASSHTHLPVPWQTDHHRHTCTVVQHDVPPGVVRCSCWVGVLTVAGCPVCLLSGSEGFFGESDSNVDKNPQPWAKQTGQNFVDDNRHMDFAVTHAWPDNCECCRQLPMAARRVREGAGQGDKRSLPHASLSAHSTGTRRSYLCLHDEQDTAAP